MKTSRSDETDLGNLTAGTGFLSMKPYLSARGSLDRSALAGSPPLAALHSSIIWNVKPAPSAHVGEPGQRLGRPRRHPPRFSAFRQNSGRGATHQFRDRREPRAPDPFGHQHQRFLVGAAFPPRHETSDSSRHLTAPPPNRDGSRPYPPRVKLTSRGSTFRQPTFGANNREHPPGIHIFPFPVPAPPQPPRPPPLRLRS